jgi:hypothetical protein
MTASPLQAALRAGAQGLYVLEAATGLIIAHGTWLARGLILMAYASADERALRSDVVGAPFSGLAEHHVEFGVEPDRPHLLGAAARGSDFGSPFQRLLA